MRLRRKAIRGISITNIALIFFWISLLGSGIIKSFGVVNHTGFAIILQQCQPLFRIFALSGGFIVFGLGLIIFALLSILTRSPKSSETLTGERIQPASIGLDHWIYLIIHLRKPRIKKMFCRDVTNRSFLFLPPQHRLEGIVSKRITASLTPSEFMITIPSLLHK